MTSLALRYCALCNAAFLPDKRHPHQKYCSRGCYATSWARKKRGYIPPSERECPICHRLFLPDIWHPHATVCSAPCGKKQDYIRHKRRAIERAALWYKRNPKRFLEIQKGVHKRNPEKYRKIWRLKQQRRNARIANVAGSGITRTQWDAIIFLQSGRCWWCGYEKPLTIDHVVPIVKGGQHDLGNIVAACKSCNSRKRDRLWPLDFGKLYHSQFDLRYDHPWDMRTLQVA